MARYVERAENVARFIDVNHNLSLDQGETLSDQWAPLVFTAGDQEAFFRRHGQATRENVLNFLTFDLENPNSILACLSQARENARTAREIISSDMWEELNRFYLLARDAAQHGGNTDHDFFCQIKRSSYLLIGTTDVTMSHGEAWHFAQMGRLLERADKTSRILDVKSFLLLPQAAELEATFDVTQWSALLRSTSALEMYRREHGRTSPQKVIDFLLLNRRFPRSVRYCLGVAEDSLHAITRTPANRFTNRAEQELGRLRSELDFTSVDDVMRAGLHAFIDAVQRGINKTGEAIYQTLCATDLASEPQ
jgi:uncharacterized alpha-E superfamily protein